ncbi:MAG: tryptophan synthase subunit alpha [Gemmataceae bacterium]
MNLIDSLFTDLRQQGQRAFMPFLTAGDPDLETTELLVRTVVERGANLIEIGFPYSDPIADGAVIQASYTRALERGLHIDQIFDCVSRLQQHPAIQGKVPLVAMVSYSLVHRRGPAAFVERAQTAGFSGAIVPDLPVEETEALSAIAKARDFKLILLVTPTTPRERAVRIAATATGFLYCVSVTGITGERDKIPEQLRDQLAWLRQQTPLPLCVGFGVSKPEHVKMLREIADGVIVGSALVRKLEQGKNRPASELAREIGDLVGSLVQTLNPAT